MGIVLKGFDEALGRPLALKLILPEYSSAFGSIERLQREARSIARLNHPNIVTIYGVGEDQGYHFIVMEFLDGCDLADFIRNKGPLPTRAAVGYARAAAAALGFAASQRIIHRDIKPSNLFITANGTLKVMDFGLSKELDADRSLTAVGAVLGTPSYMAPEQAAGAKLCHRADIYSLGCTLFTLLTARRPYEGKTAIEVMMKHAREPLPIDAALARQLGQDVVDLLRLMTEKEPEKRPADWEALIKRMDAVLLRLDSGGSPPEPRAMTPNTAPVEGSGSTAPPTGRTSPYEALVLASLPSKPTPALRSRIPVWWTFAAVAAGIGMVVSALLLLSPSRGSQSAGAPNLIAPGAAGSPAPVPQPSNSVAATAGAESSTDDSTMEAARLLHQTVCLLASRGEFATAAERLEQESGAVRVMRTSLAHSYQDVVEGFKLAASLDHALQAQSGGRFPERERRVLEATRPGVSEPEVLGRAFIYLAACDAQSHVPHAEEVLFRLSQDPTIPAHHQRMARALGGFHEWGDGVKRTSGTELPSNTTRRPPPQQPPSPPRQRTNPGTPRQ
jgi:serine/threonine-protein kinase